MPVLFRKSAGRILRSVQSRRIFRVAGRKVVRDIQVTVASQADLEYVHSRLTSEVPFKPDPPTPQIPRFVANHHGRVVGFVELARYTPKRAPYIGFCLFNLSVMDPVCRGLGVREALTRREVEVAQDEGAKELWLVVNEHNRPATNLYHKLGVVPASVMGLNEQPLGRGKDDGQAVDHDGETADQMGRAA